MLNIESNNSVVALPKIKRQLHSPQLTAAVWQASENGGETNVSRDLFYSQRNCSAGIWALLLLLAQSLLNEVIPSC